MGVCNNESKNRKEIKSTTNSKSYFYPVDIQFYKENEITDTRVDECIIQNASRFEELDPHLSNVSKSICKIKIENKPEIIIGTGFLLKFNIDQKMFYCLISNENVIKKDIIQNNNIIICIFYDNEFKSEHIKLGNNKRYIKSFTDINLDITIVEILDEDNISKDYFLFPELEYMINNRLMNKRIYIPQYTERKELTKARGIIKDINQYEII